MARIVSLFDEPREAVRLAAEALNAGEIIVFPTDTVYGLMIRSVQPEYLARLNATKGRAEDKPVAALAADEEGLVALMRSVIEPMCGERASELVPGALTALMPSELWGSALPEELHKLPYPAIGVRLPRHAALQELLRACGGWVMATSANLEGIPTPPTMEGALEQLGSADVALAVDGGEHGDEASAVVKITAQGIEVIRSHPLLAK